MPTIDSGFKIRDPRKLCILLSALNAFTPTSETEEETAMVVEMVTALEELLMAREEHERCKLRWVRDGGRGRRGNRISSEQREHKRRTG